VTTTVSDNIPLRRFEIQVDGVLAGFADYHRHRGLIELTHTEIEPGHEGQGLAGQLIRAALDTAREEGLDVLPRCEYVRGYIERNPEYLDLVPSARRADFDLAADR
jgi:predicted GNAT family acetyltransferase